MRLFISIFIMFWTILFIFGGWLGQKVMFWDACVFLGHFLDGGLDFYDNTSR
jgi:hypothetical protein